MVVRTESSSDSGEILPSSFVNVDRTAEALLFDVEN